MIQLPGTRPILDPADFLGLQDRMKGEGPGLTPQLTQRGWSRSARAWGGHLGRGLYPRNSPEMLCVADRDAAPEEAADGAAASNSHGEARGGGGCPPGSGLPSLGSPFFPKPPAGAALSRQAAGGRHPPGGHQTGGAFPVTQRHPWSQVSSPQPGVAHTLPNRVSVRPPGQCPLATRRTSLVGWC